MTIPKRQFSGGGNFPRKGGGNDSAKSTKKQSQKFQFPNDFWWSPSFPSTPKMARNPQFFSFCSLFCKFLKSLSLRCVQQSHFQQRNNPIRSQMPPHPKVKQIPCVSTPCPPLRKLSPAKLSWVEVSGSGGQFSGGGGSGLTLTPQR